MKRVYKAAFSHQVARGIILEGDGKHFDPMIVRAFLAIEEQFKQIRSSYPDNPA
jgi:HD-GYP domain-containing protein (c-di-GMP phosphodiesterase class II)